MQDSRSTYLRIQGKISIPKDAECRTLSDYGVKTLNMYGRSLRRFRRPKKKSLGCRENHGRIRERDVQSYSSDSVLDQIRYLEFQLGSASFS